MSSNKSSKNKKSKNVLGRGLKSLLAPSLQEDIKKIPFSNKGNHLSFQESVDTTLTSSQNPSSHLEGQSWNSEKKSFVKILGIEQLQPNLNQPRKRFSSDDLEELAHSIREKGLLQPILVRALISDGWRSQRGKKAGENPTFQKYEIIAGERRWRAAQKAGLHEVPVIVKEVSDQKSLELALVENLQRKDLTPLEEARAYQNLLDQYSLSQQQLANFLGKDRVSVTNVLRVLKLPEAAQKALNSGELSLGQAKVLLYLKTEEQQLEALEKALKHNLTVAALTRMVEKMKRNQESSSDQKGSLNSQEALLQQKMPSSVLDKLSEDLKTSFGAKVHIHYSLGRGRVSFYFSSDEEFTHLMDSFLEN